MNPPDFSAAFAKTMMNEGYLVLENVSGDTGGETFSGISRVSNPLWIGWGLVDAAKAQPNVDQALKSNKALEVLVQDFYKSGYWDHNRCQDMLDQSIASEVFDMAVNCGNGQEGQYFQRALNATFEAGKYFQPLKVDGNIGQASIDALTAALKHETPQEFANALNAYAARHYIDLAEKGKQKFFRGWLRRVAILPLTRG